MTTSFGYTFYPNSTAVNQRSTTWPVVSTAQNGSGLADGRAEQFDLWGNLTWLKDERGFITNFQYDIVTGALQTRIDDALTYVALAAADIADFGYQTHTHKNWLINGDFRIWQRGTSFSPPGGGRTYTADRWCYDNGGSVSGGTLTVTQQPFALGQTAVPNNPTYYLEAALASGSSSQVPAIEQRVEDVSNFSGLNVIVSFWAKAGANGVQLSTQFTQCFGSGGSPSPSVNTSPQVNTLTTSWQQFTYQVALPSVSGKTLGTNNDDYLGLQFLLPQSAPFTVDLANVQLELGFDATDFQRRLYEEELALCQRYFQRAGKWAPFVFHASTAGTGRLALPVPMRPIWPVVQLTTTSPQVVVPNVNIYTATNPTFGVNFGSNGCRSHLEFSIGGFTGATVAKPAFLYDDYFTVEAEL